ncbi:MAG TPA: rRNA maturation RNase YbeY, partial [Oscillospiraceae bacterium]|nr:rRNA maturation RNase YbeY [Oscillospiraceae bacterium]
VDAVTDVLSFPLGENGNYDHNPETGALMLGDVVLCMQKAEEQAELYGHSLQREVAYLTVHSVLHLLGYDHVDGGLEQVRMREREETVLAKLGLQRDASYVDVEEE